MASDLLLKFTTKITGKGQTTVPKSIRDVLGVDIGDDIEFRTEEHGVVIRRAQTSHHSDPVIGGFLRFLARDMEVHPDQLQVLSPDFVDRIRGLVDDGVDVDAPIEGDVAI